MSDEIDDSEIDLIYCPVCGSCGESGCCSPARCKEGEGCLYPGFSKEIDWRLPLEQAFDLWYEKNRSDYPALDAAKKAFIALT